MTTDVVIQPTRTCFDDVGEFLEMEVKAHASKKRLESYTICHGLRLSDDTPGWHAAHAWIEVFRRGSWRVIQAGIFPEHGKAFYSVPRDGYYRQSDVRDVTRYTVFMFCLLNKRWNTTGPFEQRYLERCSDYRPGMTIADLDVRKRR